MEYLPYRQVVLFLAEPAVVGRIIDLLQPAFAAVSFRRVDGGLWLDVW
jgi:hypothetical protein